MDSTQAYIQKKYGKFALRDGLVLETSKLTSDKVDSVAIFSDKELAWIVVNFLNFFSQIERHNKSMSGIQNSTRSVPDHANPRPYET